MSTCCRNYKEIQFLDCPKHPEIRYVGPYCPVCVLEDARIKLLDKVASLEMARATAAAE